MGQAYFFRWLGGGGRGEGGRGEEELGIALILCAQNIDLNIKNIHSSVTQPKASMNVMIDVNDALIKSTGLLLT